MFQATRLLAGVSYPALFAIPQRQNEKTSHYADGHSVTTIVASANIRANWFWPIDELLATKDARGNKITTHGKRK